MATSAGPAPTMAEEPEEAHPGGSSSGDINNRPKLGYKRPSGIDRKKLRKESFEKSVDVKSNGAAAVGLATSAPKGSSQYSTADHNADLDSTGHRVRGGGILASIKDVGMDPDEFAAGCKLLQAAALGDRFRLDSLLRARPDHVHFRDYDRRTALHVAASEGHIEIVRRLVELGAGVNRSDRWGGSPLDDAHRHRQTEVAVFLRGHGATTGSADQTSNLITAAAEGDLDEMRMLLSVEARPKAPAAGGGGFKRDGGLSLPMSTSRIGGAGGRWTTRGGETY